MNSSMLTMWNNSNSPQWNRNHAAENRHKARNDAIAKRDYAKGDSPVQCVLHWIEDTFGVFPTDLEQGYPDEPEACPIAQTIYDVVDEVWAVNVGHHEVTWTDLDKKDHKIPVPPCVTAFTQRFDAHEEPLVRYDRHPAAWDGSDENEGEWA